MQIELLSNTMFGKVGDIVNVSPGVAEQMIRNRDAKPVAVVESKSLSAAGTGRAKRLELSNKAVGA